MIAEFEGDSTQLAEPVDKQTHETPVSNSTDLKIVHRLGEIPLVADGLVTFE